MPAVRFFLMLENARLIHALRRVEDCDIETISMCKIERYEELRSAYQKEARQTIGKLSGGMSAEPVSTRRAPIPADSDTAKYAMMGVFSAAKGRLH